jgi:hypothetical protein
MYIPYLAGLGDTSSLYLTTKISWHYPRAFAKTQVGSKVQAV